MLTQHGILVNAIAPGPAAMGMMGWKPGDPLERQNYLLERLACPGEIADMAVFFASDEASRIAGVALTVSGRL